MDNFEEECKDCLKEEQFYIETEREYQELELLKEINEL